MVDEKFVKDILSGHPMIEDVSKIRKTQNMQKKKAKILTRPIRTGSPELLSGLQGH